VEKDHSDHMGQCQSTHLTIAGLLTIFFTLCPAPFANGGEDKPIIITAVGDIMLANRVEEIVKEKGLDYKYPFALLKPILMEGDISIANLEGPVTLEGERVTDKTFTFKMAPESLDGIIGAGFTLFSIANNHILDFGETGLRNTLQILTAKGAFFAGAGMTITEARAPAIINVRGIRIGLLAYSATFPESFYAGETKAGTAFPHEEYLEKDIPKAAAITELLIVSFHWGQELMESPKDYQVELAHKAIDLGANLVFGHHPHVLQGIEEYHEGLIFYSLGNLVFGSYSERVKESIVSRVFFTPGTPITAEVIPIDVLNTKVLFQPRPFTGRKARSVLEHLQEISGPFGTEINIKDNRGTILIEK